MEFLEWFSTPRGRFFVTSAYLAGAFAAQHGFPHQICHLPGPQRAQYRYGYDNEKSGYHDEIDPPFDMIGKGTK